MQILFRSGKINTPFCSVCRIEEVIVLFMTVCINRTRETMRIRDYFQISLKLLYSHCRTLDLVFQKNIVIINHLSICRKFFYFL